MVRHVAIIMDGNGRWAARRGLPRRVGHWRGAEAARRIVRAAVELELPYLTLFAFSSENWNRPVSEVVDLMGLLRRYLGDDYSQEMQRLDVRVRMIGDRSRLPADLVRIVERLEDASADHKGLQLTVALSYGGRQEIVDSARRLAQRVAAGELDPTAIDEAAVAGSLETADLPHPDLLIRTGGEQRISNFLLWQLAYAELYFSDRLWPDFSHADLAEALSDYRQRDRRFGALSSTA
ncbi:polyprenyl diphosphate synthase [Aquibaculum arenosum]|uniref:Isoprenyl transferase n=1 Tax=Aquibaculum arenosum TaxID=3032591 RepID=A0ABT5YIY9_9PROT|nr:polyprenyl diphosphate synthase [Fodinicurvata sp. CAU 1616]MDF2094750.1 polyprenyl diphosphate synthase [Fodinicurvata sp. CAU 1616]